MRGRLVGLFFLAAGAAIAWFGALGPLEEARAGATEIRVGVTSFIFAPMALVTGVLLIIGGNWMLEQIDGPPQSPLQWAITVSLLAVLAVTGLGGYFWFEGQMTALGFNP